MEMKKYAGSRRGAARLFRQCRHYPGLAVCSGDHLTIFPAVHGITAVNKAVPTLDMLHTGAMFSRLFPAAYGFLVAGG